MDFKVGDKVIATSSEAHIDEPHAAPEVGTIGTLIKHCNLTRWRVKWADGSTTEDDVWGANECDFELWAKKELTALEYITEWQRYNKELQRAGQAERLSTILDPEMIDVVAKWAAEHPKPEPISASDFAKLQAIYLLFGDCYVCKDESGFCCAHKEEPSKGGEFWVSADGWVMERFVIDCISWQDEKPLHLTEQWLKEVEHG